MPDRESFTPKLAEQIGEYVVMYDGADAAVLEGFCPLCRSPLTPLDGWGSCADCDGRWWAKPGLTWWMPEAATEEWGL